jgi:hypothetical protein
MKMAIKRVEINNQSYVPLREAVESVGGTVEWDNQTKTATVTSDGRIISVRMADENVVVDGVSRHLQRPPLVKDDTIYVPEEFFSTALGRAVFLS